MREGEKPTQRFPRISRNIPRHAFGDALSGASEKKADIPGGS